MDLMDIINSRRAYRSLDDIEITGEMIDKLAEAARLSPSCFNNQPWRYVFVRKEEKLKELHEALPGANEWATHSSMIIAPFSRADLDCQIKDREYFLFDTGLATAFMILRATEMGLVAHPMAGYDEKKAKEILEIPEEMRLICLIGVGTKSDEIKDYLTDKQVEWEKERPERMEKSEFVFKNTYKERE